MKRGRLSHAPTINGRILEEPTNYYKHNMLPNVRVMAMKSEYVKKKKASTALVEPSDEPQQLSKKDILLQE